MIKATKPLISIHLTNNPTIASEGNFYFLEYLELKLFRFNLVSFVSFERLDFVIPERIQNTSDRIQEICGLLEHLYPKLYIHVSRQLKVNFKNEVIICDVFRSFCRALFKTKITWPRVIALFSFAGGVVIDCIRARKAEFARTVVYCVKAFVEDNLTGWIRQQGGWVNITEHFQNLRQIPTWYSAIVWFPGVTWSLLVTLIEKLEILVAFLKGNRLQI